MVCVHAMCALCVVKGCAGGGGSLCALRPQAAASVQFTKRKRGRSCPPPCPMRSRRRYEAASRPPIIDVFSDAPLFIWL